MSPCHMSQPLSSSLLDTHIHAQMPSSGLLTPCSGPTEKPGRFSHILALSARPAL